MKKNDSGVGIFLAVLAAALYAVNAPCSKKLLDIMPPTLMAGFLYIGAGVGVFIIYCFQKIAGKMQNEESITKKELPYTFAMIVLDVAAPIFLMLGLSMTDASSAALLNNFEIVATSLIALLIFKESISKRLWLGIIFITTACTLLSFDGIENTKLSAGSVLILLACICWGLENNCTRKLSKKDPRQVVVIKGIFSGLGSLAIGFCIGERVTHIWSIIAVLTVGFIAYGLSIYCYVYAQRYLGAARTSAYYAIAPFIGALLSLVIFKEMPRNTYFAVFVLMLIGAWLSGSDEPIFKRKGSKNEP